jgi:DNA-binding CsgD family transcriptional regulator
VSDEPAAVPAVPSGRASQLAAALSVLELGDCERELLVRATATGSAATIPSQGAEWDAKELAEAADALAHDGLVQRGRDDNVVRRADDLRSATTVRARREGARAASRLGARSIASHAAIMSRCTTPPRPLRQSGDLEADFRALLVTHRIVINAYPSFLPRNPDLEFFNAAALAATRLTAGLKVEADVVSSRRLRMPVECEFFAAQAAVPGSSIAVADDVAIRLTLLDDSRAVIPLDPLDHEAGGWVIDDPEAVAQVGLQLSQYQAASAPWIPPRIPLLSQRETQVIQLLAQGLTDDGIARRLRVTDRTVRRTVAELMAKLGVESRFALAVECARHALV